MANCPNCGSTAQVTVQTTDYQENGWEMDVIRYCTCGCGETFTATSRYVSDGFETVNLFPRKRLIELFYGGG